MVIPERFMRRIDAHMLGNMLDIEHYPLILTIIGNPGMGKTYQLRNYLSMAGVTIFSVSAADLESDLAGKPAKLLQKKYIQASHAIFEGTPSVMLIDDIDTTLGEWENHTGTVNHQDVLAFLMHIADSPTYIDDIGTVKRVPIFFTGNDFERLYKPLIRDGRAARFDWEPERDEKVLIVQSIFTLDDKKSAEMLVDAYPTEKISFFSSLMISKRVEKLSEIAGSATFKSILTNAQYRDNLRLQYSKSVADISWDSIIQEALKDVASHTATEGAGSN